MTTQRLLIAATSMTLAMAMPWQLSSTYAGGDGPTTPVVAKDAPAPADADQPKPDAQEAHQQVPAKTSSAHLLADPKPLSDEVKKGLQWLVSHQLDNGGWGQGEESEQMRRNAKEKGKLADTANVGDTCAAALTLLRSGSTPSSGTYDVNLRKAAGYVCESIEAANDEDLYITKIRNTRLQSKLGTYVDTFLAAQLLSEFKGKMPDDKANERVDACLAKVIKKIEAHQNEDGKFGGQGWAMSLNDAIANTALNRAAQAGAEVQQGSLEKSRKNAAALNAPATPDGEGKFAAADGTAGIELYGAANSVSGQRETDTTYRQQIEQQRDEIRKVLEQAKAQAGEDKAGKEIKDQADAVLTRLDKAGDDVEESQAIASSVEGLTLALGSEEFGFDQDKLDSLAGFGDYNGRWADNKKNLNVAQTAVVNRLNDDKFVAGFGNNGGEEFLSYTRIGESLYIEGGEAWKTFEKKMTENLTNVQNKDGSWSGHHCITGRTFCTSAALSVLMTDRMHVPEELLEQARLQQAEQKPQDLPEEAE